MKKMVNGETVDCSAEEVAAFKAREAAFLAEKANPKPVPKTDSEEIADLKKRLAALEAKP